MLEAQPAALEAGGVVTGGTVHLLWLIVSSFSFYGGRKGEGEKHRCESKTWACATRHAPCPGLTSNLLVHGAGRRQGC